MAKQVHLNGGPWHDRSIVLRDDQDHFHIAKCVDGTVTQTGTYSAVRHYHGEFEWDGWRSHD